MVVLVGIWHDLQWNWKYVNDIAIEVHRQNLCQYLPWLEESINKNRVEIVGEEAGAGMLLEELLKEHDCRFTFLQEIANKLSLEYFRFDLPPDQLSSFGTRSKLADYREKKRKFSPDERETFCRDREKWFHKTITARIRKDQNGLVILGAKHLQPLQVSLQQSGYEVNGQDVACFEWYKDPTDEAIRQF